MSDIGRDGEGGSEIRCSNLDTPSQNDSQNSKKQCWICFGEEKEGYSTEEWTSPCLCRGSTKWVHQKCLLAWLAANTPQYPLGNGVDPLVNVGIQNGSDYFLPFRPPLARCPQCRYAYHIKEATIFPRQIMVAISAGKRLVDQFLFSASIGGILLSGYSLCSLYGLAVVSTVSAIDIGELLLPWAKYSSKTILSDGIYWFEVFTKSLHIARVAVGLPLVPFFILSIRYPRLSWLYPLVPSLVYNGQGSFVPSWPPSSSLVTAMLPFYVLLYSRLHSMHFSRFSDQDASESSRILNSPDALINSNIFSTISLHLTSSPRLVTFSQTISNSPNITPSPLVVDSAPNTETIEVMSSASQVVLDGEASTLNVPENSVESEAANNNSTSIENNEFNQSTLMANCLIENEPGVIETNEIDVLEGNENQSNENRELGEIVPSPPTTMLNEDDEDSQSLRISIIETTSTLLLPFLSAICGKILMPMVKPPLLRTICGAAVVCLLRDGILTLSTLQVKLSRRTRRVLDFSP